MNITAYNLHKESSKLFPIETAEYKRDWMDSYTHSFAYRCLPLKIANESGWLIRCPIDFTAEYVNDDNPTKSVNINITGGDKDIYSKYIRSHFGRGVITFSIPYLFRTPGSWCIWARGYPNYYKHNVSFLEGIIETYWSYSTFTYNIRLIEKNILVEFKRGEPIMFFTCIDLNELNKSSIQHIDINTNPDLKKAYEAWSISRSNFNQSQRSPEDWQKDYFKGLKTNNEIQEQHLTTIKLYVNNTDHQY